MTRSKSDIYLSNKSGIPEITNRMKKSVSEQRRILLNEDFENGLYRQGSEIISKKNGMSSLGVVMGGGTTKTAQLAGSTSSFAGSQGDSFRQGPEIYSPLWLTSNLSLPRDRVTVNAWSRAFFALNPMVANAINLHSTYPISKLNIKCKNKKIEKFFNEMIEETNLMNFCIEMAHEYWLLGEVFPYMELDETTGKWSRLIIQNPDYMIIKRTTLSEPIIMMKPDEHLRKICSSNKASDIEERKQLNPSIIDYVRRGGNIPMNNFNASYLSRKINPYELRGTGLVVTIFRQLMLFDMLRESKYVQASSMVNPTTLVKVGSAEDKPTEAQLEGFRAIFEQAEHDKNFKIFTHDAVSVERVGFGGGIYDISGDITQLIKEMYIGMMVPSVIMDGGQDTTYANGGVALDVLKQRYMTFRNIMGEWLKRKVFAPISQLQEFYEFEDGEKKLIIPEIDWNHMNLFDAGDYISVLKELSISGEGDKKVSIHTLYRSLGLDYTDERINIRKESIQEEIFKKEKESLTKMTLNDLRALDEDDEIPEEDDASVAGEAVAGEDSATSGESSGSESPVPDLSAPPPL